MGKKQESKTYLWTEKAGRLIFGKGIKPGSIATLWGKPINDKDEIKSWLKHGYIVPAEGGANGKA